nr:gephyrin-like isoform X1 [Procambarus clarkii]
MASCSLAADVLRWVKRAPLCVCVGFEEFTMSRIIRVGVLTVSDRCSSGSAVDESGCNLQGLVDSGELFNGEVCKYLCVEDNATLIKEVLEQWCDDEKLQLILTTGGTGLAFRDVTPEAVKEVIKREVPGMSLYMLMESLLVTPLAMLSRPVCGCRDQTLIITLPGSKKGSEECLRFVAPAISHAVDVLMGWNVQVEKTHDVLKAQGTVKSASTQTSGTLKGHADHKPSKADVTRICTRWRKSPYPMMAVSQALEIVLSRAEVCPNIKVRVDKALGFVLAKDIFAKDSLPPFPASIKDGYAVLASDGAGLRIVADDSTAGCEPKKCQVSSGVCVRVNTGAPIPPGADAVVQVEDTELVKAGDDNCTELEIKILKAPTQGQDIRPVGCDIATGQKILASGTLLGPSELGLLASVGAVEVLVVGKPTVAVLSTGNELQEPNEPLIYGHIRDSNRVTIKALLQQFQYPVIDMGIAKDDPTALMKKMKCALARVDVLVTSGGVSMGERDILRPVLVSDFNADIHFAQLFMKPGKPTTFATCMFEGKKKLILGLPGNPVSAVVTSTLFILPLCRKMSGRSACENTCMRAKLSEMVKLDPRPEYHRATLTWVPGEDIPVAHSTGNQLSSRLLSMASAQVLLKLPAATPERESLPAGTLVDALLLSL